jgi:hypothetical protein
MQSILVSTGICACKLDLERRGTLHVPCGASNQICTTSTDVVREEMFYLLIYEKMLVWPGRNFHYSVAVNVFVGK